MIPTRNGGIAVALLGLLWLAGCVPATVYVPVRQVSMVGEGITIRAVDGGFALQAGAPFAPPFQMKCVGSGRTVKTEQIGWGDYEQWRQGGARPVQVTVPGRAEPLHGLLAICEKLQGTVGPAADFYRIELENADIDAAAHGLLTVRFELAPIGDGSYDDYAVAWALFLHDKPYGAGEVGP